MIEYTVTENDTLRKIANYFNVLEEDIKRINNLDSDIIEEGMVLQIPFSFPIEYYSVISGDDLFTVSKKFDVPVEILAKINGLRVDEYIYPNQKLLVPKEGYQIYITESGDTILNVHNKLNLSIDDVIQSNPNLYLLPEQLIIFEKDKVK